MPALGAAPDESGFNLTISRSRLQPAQCIARRFISGGGPAAREPAISLPHPEQLLGIQNDHPGTPLPGALDEIPGPSRPVPLLLVPEGDQGDVLAAQGEGVVEHPEVVALPDAVVLLLGEPGRQVL